MSEATWKDTFRGVISVCFVVMPCVGLRPAGSACRTRPGLCGLVQQADYSDKALSVNRILTAKPMLGTLCVSAF